MNTLKEKMDLLLDFVRRQLKQEISIWNQLNVTGGKVLFPFVTRNGKWSWEDKWSNGFFAGQLWLMFAMDQDEFWKESADKATTALEPYKYHGDFQDIGYLFIFSYITGYKLTGNSKYRTVALEAADSLFDSLMPGGYLKCNWLADGEHYQGIDAMMNIGLWLWAFRETDNSKYRIAAEGCIDNILRTMIFSDGRTCEYVKFNGEDREIEIYNKNAAEANSVWSRGHSWAIYGMVQAFLNLGHFEYLDVIDKLTSFYQKNTDDSLIPHWDMLIKHQTTLRDASAASIVASALLQLASHLDDKSQKKAYADLGLSILDTLITNTYMASSVRDHEGILLHASTPKSVTFTKGESQIWGDYFLLETILNLQNVNLRWRANEYHGRVD